MALHLVERFVGINGWRTSRKTALLAGGVALPGHLIIALNVTLLLTRVDAVDASRLVLLSWLYVAHSVLTAVVSYVVDRRCNQGNWTFFFFSLPYGVLSALTMYQFGVASTPVLTWYPVIILVVGLWYDAWALAFAFVFGVFLYAPLFFLAAHHSFDYAPALKDRSLDAQTDPKYVISVGLLVMMYVAVGSLCAFMNAKARLLQHNRLNEANSRLDEAAHLIARYVPAEIAEGIFAGTSDIAEGHHRRKVSVFFSDLVGFSDIAEELEPEDLALVLNEYFTEMTTIARRHGGTVDELQGDALLIFFGAPRRTNDKDQALRAVAMACEMHEALDRLNSKWRDGGITEQLAARMAINTGVVTVGNFGSADRTKYAVLGKHVNIAARLQAQCEPGRTLLSYATWLLVKDSVECESVGLLQLKGIAKPVEAFEVLGETVERPQLSAV